MAESGPNHRPRLIARWQCALLTALNLLIALGVALTGSPPAVQRFGAGFAAISAVSFFLRVGWVVPCMIAGTYLGFLFEPPFGHGTQETAMRETAGRVVVGLGLGLIIGLLIENYQKNGRS